uniref:Putative secreted protein n=1 Tax=Ixodes ricinus TaxID=34613 RepID=V5H6Y8_IXORI
MGPFIGLLLLVGASTAWGAAMTPAIDTEEDLDPNLMTTFSDLLGERIKLEKARTVEPSEEIKEALDANLEHLTNAFKGREDDLAVILAILEDLREAGNQSFDDADEYRRKKKKSRKPCGCNNKKRKKPKIGRIIGRIIG